MLDDKSASINANNPDNDSYVTIHAMSIVSRVPQKLTITVYTWEENFVADKCDLPNNVHKMKIGGVKHKFDSKSGMKTITVQAAPGKEN